MSDTTLLDDFDTNVTHAFTVKIAVFMLSFVVLWCFVCAEQGAMLCRDTIALVHHPFLPEKSITVDTSLIPFIYFVSGRCISKRAKMPALPNVSQINDIPARMGAPWRVS